VSAVALTAAVCVTLLTRVSAAATPEPVPSTAAAATPTPLSSLTPTPVPPYVQRGDAVEARNRAYKDRLRRYYDTLCAQLKAEASDLYPQVKNAPPKPARYGYRLLPKLLPLPTPGPTPPRPRAVSRWYTWPWTEQKIDLEMKKLDESTAELEHTPTLPPAQRHAMYKILADGYPGLLAAQRNIDSHVQYNRLWQPEIARHKAIYDTHTHLHDAVLERQAILDALEAKDDAAFRKALDATPNLNRTPARPQLEAELRGREAALAREIHDVIDTVTPPKYVRVEQRMPHRWVVHVPFITDINDAAFLRGVRQAIEHVWHIRDRGDEFRVELSMQYISPDDLYRRRPGCESGGDARCRPPQKGDAIDEGTHVALFPPDAAVLTTGGKLTHAWGFSIVLGPEDVKPHLLAHEFGHLLGFRDEYFRGYRDLGPNGFQVMEVVAEPDDVMGNPGAGPVRRHQFERLISAAGS